MIAEAQCTWGDGPDVLVVIDQAAVGFMAHLREPRLASFALTIEAAKALIVSLSTAVVRAEELDKAYDEAMRNTPR